MSAAAASLLPVPCAAQDDPFIHGAISIGAGLFFGYQFATQPERSGFEWGLEGYATQRFGDVGKCTSGKRWALARSSRSASKGSKIHAAQ
ncbi:MAG TPA: hypothetical protein VFN67_41175 [Polyangiales bacterium]|nr:hypothetical protein [Polyangiales bacterium]